MSESKRRKAVYMGRQTRHEPSKCLGCGKLIDTASAIGSKRKPRPGSITICLICGHLQAYGEGLRLRPLTDREMVEVAGDERIIAIQKARAVIFATGQKPP
jgi:hypothetical protein